MRREDAFECFLYLIVTHKSTKPCLPFGFRTKHNINDVSFNVPSNQPGNYWLVKQRILRFNVLNM